RTCCERPIISNDEVARRLAIRARFSRDGSTRARRKCYSRRIRGEEEPPGVLGAFAQTQSAGGRPARLNAGANGGGTGKAWPQDLARAIPVCRMTPAAWTKLSSPAARMV